MALMAYCSVMRVFNMEFFRVRLLNVRVEPPDEFCLVAFRAMLEFG